ncbi:IclR family transcriptional regulator [Neomicrococcus aestuarii]|uniref:Urocanate hydratase n=1 Tax=Neomicrococcus aestuarii TaxID=556325 RepID=A0A7W8TSZ0_9MICC|nr:IclR family transcriptional regulator [Neomicrococcus aestuarii]MBB5511495.1 urocanate hydratase [Neomicrococcus aestuarii]
MAEEKADATTRAADRVLDLLRVVCESSDGIRLADAAKATELSASTALRLLRTLEAKGFVTRREEKGEYRPGFRMVQLGVSALSHESLVETCRPIMRDVVASTGESCYLSIRADAETGLYLAIEEGTQSVRHINWVGRRFPLAGAASGEVLRNEIPANEYAMESNFVEEDVTAIAAPVVIGGAVVASLSVVAPSYRTNKTTAKLHGEALVRAAASLNS